MTMFSKKWQFKLDKFLSKNFGAGRPSQLVSMVKFITHEIGDDTERHYIIELEVPDVPETRRFGDNRAVRAKNDNRTTKTVQSYIFVNQSTRLTYNTLEVIIENLRNGTWDVDFQWRFGKDGNKPYIYNWGYWVRNIQQIQQTIIDRQQKEHEKEQHYRYGDVYDEYPDTVVNWNNLQDELHQAETKERK